MRQNPKNPRRVNGRPRVDSARLTLQRAIEILLALRRGTAVQEVDPALDREQLSAVADLAAYYFSARGSNRGGRLRASDRPAVQQATRGTHQSRERIP